MSLTNLKMNSAHVSEQCHYRRMLLQVLSPTPAGIWVSRLHLQLGRLALCHTLVPNVTAKLEEDADMLLLRVLKTNLFHYTSYPTQCIGLFVQAEVKIYCSPGARRFVVLNGALVA